MKIVKMSITLLLAGMLLLSGCADTDSSFGEGTSREETDSAAQDSAAETTSGDPAAGTASSEALPVYDYVHGSEGYYNLAEELKYFKMPVQTSGTCWLHAARASMQTSYEKSTGKEVGFSIEDLLEDIYGDDKQEGIFIKEGIPKDDIGGYQGFVTGRLSGEIKDGITLDSSMMIDPTDREAVKNAVKTRGGVAASVCDKNVESKTFGSYLTVNYEQPEEYDHYVTVIGWDDHFPKEYFKVPAAEDGAWITYNSNAGGMYYYISYCAPIDHMVSHTVSDEYSEVLSYDAGNEIDAYITTGDSVKTANVFHKKGRLAAVGTFNDFDSQDIKIEIMSADFKDVLYTQDASLDWHGCHTIKLTTPVDVEDYAVVITYSKGAPVEGESIDTAAGSYKTSIEKGQSFVLADGKWKDMSDSDIKSAVRTDKGQAVFFNEKGAWRNFMTDSDMEALLKTDFTPGNCCIKALYTE